MRPVHVTLIVLGCLCGHAPPPRKRGISWSCSEKLRGNCDLTEVTYDHRHEWKIIWLISKVEYSDMNYYSLWHPQNSTKIFSENQHVKLSNFWLKAKVNGLINGKLSLQACKMLQTTIPVSASPLHLLYLPTSTLRSFPLVDMGMGFVLYVFLELCTQELLLPTL